MYCKYCGKNLEDLKLHELNGYICNTCRNKVEMSIFNSRYIFFMGSLKEMCLNDAFDVIRKWLEKEFSIVRFNCFKIDSRLKYDVVLVYTCVKEMMSVKFPVIVEIRVLYRNNNASLKITLKDDTKTRETYIFGDRENNNLMSEANEIRYVKTDMRWVEKELKDVL